MTKFPEGVSRSALASFLLLGLLPAAIWAGDLSRYRNFQLGTELGAVAKQAGWDPAQAKVIHRRPALIQELAWRPQALGASSQTEPAKEVIFSFYNGQLFQLVIHYDRYETEGMTTADFIDGISMTYGTAITPTTSAKDAQVSYREQEEVVAQWQDPEYCFELIRSSYGPSFRLVGVLKRLEAPAQAALQEAKRLDDQEAPQRDSERVAREDEAERAKLDKARLLNKPKFRP